MDPPPATPPRDASPLHPPRQCAHAGQPKSLAREAPDAAPCPARSPVSVVPTTLKARMTSFSDLNLAQPLLRALEAEGYTVPTPIQAAAIPRQRNLVEDIGRRGRRASSIVARSVTEPVKQRSRSDAAQTDRAVVSIGTGVRPARSTVTSSTPLTAATLRPAPAGAPTGVEPAGRRRCCAIVRGVAAWRRGAARRWRWRKRTLRVRIAAADSRSCRAGALHDERPQRTLCRRCVQARTPSIAVHVNGFTMYRPVKPPNNTRHSSSAPRSGVGETEVP